MDLNHELEVRDLAEYILEHLPEKEARIVILIIVDRLSPDECACEEGIAPMSAEEVMDEFGKAFVHIRQILAKEDELLSSAEVVAKERIATN
ncbi:MAG: hypothetical protein NTV72_03145 [Candidatus Taylorbacteria bacterium]|nr:hypothetical protein [Candidatus Taylorbacteria bacterium]